MYNSVKIQTISFISSFIIFTWAWIVFLQNKSSNIESEIFLKYFSYYSYLLIFVAVLILTFKISFKKKQVSLITKIIIVFCITNVVVYLFMFLWGGHVFEWETQKINDSLIYIINKPFLLEAFFWGITTNLLWLFCNHIYKFRWYLGVFYTMIISFFQLNYFHCLTLVTKVTFSFNKIIVVNKSLISKVYEYKLNSTSKLFIEDDYSVEYNSAKKFKYYQISISDENLERNYIINGIPQTLIPTIHSYIEEINHKKENPVITKSPRNYKVYLSSDSLYIEKKPSGIKWYFWMILIIFIYIFSSFAFSIMNDSSKEIKFFSWIIIIGTYLFLGYKIYYYNFVFTHVRISNYDIYTTKKPFTIMDRDYITKFDDPVKISYFSIFKKEDNETYYLRITFTNQKYYDIFEDTPIELEKLKVYLEQKLKNTSLYSYY